MANCHELFLQYNAAIKLPEYKRNELIVCRDTLRNSMLKRFDMIPMSQRNGHELSFQSQGSFVMDTIINPLNNDYDIDDGVYFQGSLDRNKRPFPQFFHDLVKNSIGVHGGIEKIIDKPTCIRVQYKDGFHIDLPIYYADNYKCPDLAHKEGGWILSNPVEFIAWFESHTKSGFEVEYLYESVKYSEKYEAWLTDIRKQDCQLRRIVRYLKSWADLKRDEMPCGIVMTILATENYFESGRDDIALKETLINIQAKLTKEFVCRRPTTPIGENLLHDYTNKQYFMNSLAEFITNAKKGLIENNQKLACKHWQKSLGNRMPCHLAKDIIEDRTSSLGLAIGASTNRPWGIQVY